jgi:ABC-type phosphonate transport system ATPase subunit
MIETQDLTKTYRGVDAVRDVTFTAAPGRVTGFLGLNGSGVIGKFQSRLPLSSMLVGASGNPAYLRAFALWTALLPAGAISSIRRDLSGS